MSVYKRCFFTMLAAIIAFVAVGRLNVQTEGFDVPTPNSRPHDSALAPEGLLWHMGPPANRLGRSDWDKAFRAKNEIRPAVFLPVQFNNAKDLDAGKLLVASRRLADPHFAKTVVLLTHYDAKGVVGLILNRRTDVPLSRALEGLEVAKHLSDPVYLGESGRNSRDICVAPVAGEGRRSSAHCRRGLPDFHEDSLRTDHLGST